MSDDEGTPPAADSADSTQAGDGTGAPDTPWPLTANGGRDPFDLLGNEIAALLRSTHEISDATRRDAEAEAEARLAEAERRASELVAEAEARRADIDRDADRRLAEIDREVASRAAAVTGREEAALAVFELATALVQRLDQRISRVAAESRAATADLTPLKAALERGRLLSTSTEPAAAAPADEPTTAADAEVVIDLRDAEPTEELVTRRKGKHKRRRKADQTS